MASRDIEIELMANMQELLAQQKVALKMMGRILELHESLLKLRSDDLEEENKRGRSRTPVRPRRLMEGNEVDGKEVDGKEVDGKEVDGKEMISEQDTVPATLIY